MRIRIAFGAILGLAVTFAFVFLQLRAEAIAQQGFSENPQPLDAAPIATDDSAFDNNEATPDSNDPFDGEAKPAGNSDPFAPADGAPPETEEAFGFEAGLDSTAEDKMSSRQASIVRQHPLQIIRLRNVQATVAHSIVWNLFQNEATEQRWFLAVENQSNSMLFKGPTKRFEQIKRLISGLDRLAEIPADSQKTTYTWPVDELSDDNSELHQKEWPIRIIRLRFLQCREFAKIAWELVNSQKLDTQLVLEFEPFTNTVLMRGPAVEIENVEQLALQLDQPPTGPAAGDLQAAPSPPPTGAPLDPFGVSPETATWETLQAPADRADELREQVAQLDARSVALAREVRTLQKRYAEQHPKITAARRELESLLEQSFQSRLQIQSIEVSILQSRLKKIESRVHQRAQLREQIIDRRLHELLGEKDDLSWEVVQPDLKIEFDSSENLPGPGGTILEPSSPAQQP